MENTASSVYAINRVTLSQKLKNYTRHPFSLAVFIVATLAAVVAVAVLVTLIVWVLIRGIPSLSLDMFSFDYTTENQSMLPAIINTLFMVAVALIIAGPLGIGSAIYLVEYAKRGNKFVNVIRLTTETLQGIPSIIYGLFGFLCFNGALHMGYSILSGGLTLAIMVLPVIMRTTEEALIAVPDSYREGSFGLGAG